MMDLERILLELRVSEVRKGKALSRKFIVVEGIYLNYGDVAPLPELVRLKKEFKYRLIVDEHLSFGVLGKRGAGISDHFNLPV
jgi:serine palmitoyltransferase